VVSYATKAMLPELIEIWKECFGDSEEYISFFFKEKLIGNEIFDNQLVWLEQGKPVAMLSMLPAKLVSKEKKVPMWYIYAVATKTEWRKRGFAGALVDYANELAEKQEGVTALVPASGSLFEYYQKLGYKTAFLIKEWESVYMADSFKDYGIDDSKIIISEELSSIECSEMRNCTFSGETFVMWDAEAVNYALKENIEIGGKNFKIQYGSEKYFMLCYIYNSCCIVRETSVPEEIFDIVIKKISRMLNNEEKEIILKEASECSEWIYETIRKVCKA